MKRLFAATLLVVALFLSANAQLQRGLKGTYNVENYPEVSFTWNTADPQQIDKSQVVLTENGKNVDFKFSPLASDNKSHPKSILILWEDMASHKGQYAFSRQLLTNFFYNTSFSDSDRFNVAVFNRKKDYQGLLTLLGSSFETGSSALYSMVENYRQSKETFGSHPIESDLYLAINNGIDILKKEPSNRAGVIVVITAGLNMKAPGASTEMETTRRNALDAGIPVYIVNYSIYGQTPETQSLAESTHGNWVATKDAYTACSELQSMYQDMDRNLSGRDYKITFTTSAKRDGKAHDLGLSIDKVPQNIPAFTAPNMTFGDWVSENLILFIILVVVFIGLVVLAIILISKSKAKQKQRIAESEANMQSQVDASNQRFEDLKRQQEEKERQQIAEQQRIERENEENRLAKLMQIKNLYPRLHCQMPESSSNFVINKPRTTIGRNGDNDIVLNNPTVSGFHATITFNGAAFEVNNESKSYKQGIIVNGQFFQNTVLRNGDKIGLGEAVITFYI